VQIKPDGTTAELPTAQEGGPRAARRCGRAAGRRPPNWKDNGTTTERRVAAGRAPPGLGEPTGRLRDVDGRAGRPLVAISAQNEPNYTAPGTPAGTTTPDMSHVRSVDYPGGRRWRPRVRRPVMAPETPGLGSVRSRYADPLMADTGAGRDDRPGRDALLRGNALRLSSRRRPRGKVAVGDGSLRRQGDQVSGHEIDSESGRADDSRKPGHAASPPSLLVADAGHRRPATALLACEQRAAAEGVGDGNWSRFVRPGFVRVDVDAEARRTRRTSPRSRIRRGRASSSLAFNLLSNARRRTSRSRVAPSPR
jgi:hypothetical protein